MILLLRITIIISTIFFTFNLALSQQLASPISPGELPLDKQLGILIGFGSNFQSGEFYVECDDCIFENGNGFGFTLGALYEQELFETLYLGGQLLYDNMNITSTYREREPIPFRIEGTDEFESVPVLFRHKGEVKVSYFTIAPYIKWSTADFFFLKLALNGSFVINANLKHTQELLDKKVLLSNGETATISFADGSGNTRTLQDEKLPQLNSFQLYFSPAIAFNFRLSHRLYFSPEFQYNLPLNNISEFGNAFKINSWRFLIEFRYSLKENRVSYIH